MRLYDRDTLSTLVWPTTTEGEYARNYLEPIINKGPQHYIDNVLTTYMVIQDGALILPVSVNHTEYQNSYVCSPYGQYIRYGVDEIHQLYSFPMRSLCQHSLQGLGCLLKMGRINQTIHINNWLLSTNLYPDLTAQQIRSLTELLTELFPNHAILFRSVNATQTELLELLEKQGYSKLFSRQVYLLDTQSSEPFNERHFKKDLILLENSGYEVVSPDAFSLNDVPRIAELYRALNIEKHSIQNPQFNEAFIRLGVEKHALTFHGLRKDGSLDAIFGSIQRGQTMAAPFFGYDTGKPEELGLYRQLSALAVLKAKQNGFLLNQSSGAGSFKKRRKAKPVSEFHVVYTRHLPAWRQLPWNCMQSIGQRFILPFVEKHSI